MFDFLEPFILKCKNYGKLLLDSESYIKIEKDVIPRITDVEHIRKRIQ